MIFLIKEEFNNFYDNFILYLLVSRDYIVNNNNSKFINNYIIKYHKRNNIRIILILPNK